MHMISNASFVPILRAVADKRYVLRWMRWLELCVARSTERRTLESLNDDQLRDIGLSKSDVARECRRWAWDGSARTADAQATVRSTT